LAHYIVCNDVVYVFFVHPLWLLSKYDVGGILMQF